MPSRRLIVVFVMVVVAGAGVWWLLRSGELHDAGCGSDPDGPSALIGFDPESGEVRWDETVGMVHGAAQVGDVVITRVASAVLRAHDIESGALLWCQPVESAAPTHESFVGLAGTDVGVAIPSAGDIVGVGTDGSELWRTAAPYASVWLYGGDVVWVFDGSTSDPRERYVALAATTGATVPEPPELPPWHGLMAYGFDSTPTSAGEFDLWWASDDVSEAYDIDVAVSRSGVEVWRQHLPGELAAITESSVGHVVVVSDASRGSGDVGDFGQPELVGYSAADGAKLWTTPLRTLPSLIAAVDASHLVVPQASELLVVDPATGTIQWNADLGSPGRGGSYSLPGHYSLIATGTAGTGVGLINANQPTRD